ncbi:unnamed protein product [Gongylonema pulchrum]|uniref:Uncharacterized protein n=1 Tax=Gongylonema pulchrum TaxID=637853 RepID=A0A183EKM4_9BILA|nr:unnamed protein product [Gongylonema pulchrum]
MPPSGELVDETDIWAFNVLKHSKIPRKSYDIMPTSSKCSGNGSREDKPQEVVMSLFNSGQHKRETLSKDECREYGAEHDEHVLETISEFENRWNISACERMLPNEAVESVQRLLQLPAGLDRVVAGTSATAFDSLTSPTRTMEPPPAPSSILKTKSGFLGKRLADASGGIFFFLLK